jgi:hypothetical protein
MHHEGRITISPSNRRAKWKMQFALDERGNAKMYYLSPLCISDSRPNSPPTLARGLEAACLRLRLVRSRSPERCFRRWPRPCSWFEDSTSSQSSCSAPLPSRCSSGNSLEAASASAAVGSRRDRMAPDRTVGTTSCRRGTREPGFLVVQEGGCVAVFMLGRLRRMRDSDEVDVEGLQLA